ncbi:hypothetical protein NAP1_10358 [Erythrobacter sp. NAP1]|nr:hypothetical protein NAP1_10358 [Erythrobacter sp. NAP1]
MTAMRTALVLVSAFALAACGSDPAPNEPEAVETPMPVEPDGGIGDGAGPLPEDVLANRIPTRFHGAWDYVGGTCDLASDMRMEISGSEILFYESVGIVTAAEAAGDAVIVDLAMEGEGETWQQRTQLMIEGQGSDERLLTSDGDLPPTVDEHPSKRCP